MKKLLALTTSSIMIFALSSGITSASPQPNCMQMSTKSCAKLLKEQDWPSGWQNMMKNVQADAKAGEEGQEKNYNLLRKLYSGKKKSVSKSDGPNERAEAPSPSKNAMSELASYDEKIKRYVSERNKIAAKAGHYKLVLMATPPPAKKGSKGYDNDEEGNAKLITLKEAERPRM